MNKTLPGELSPSEFAAVRDRSVEAIYDGIRRGMIAARKVRVISYEWRIPASEVERFAAKSASATT